MLELRCDCFTCLRQNDHSSQCKTRRSFGFGNKCQWWQYTRPSFDATSRHERKQFVELRSVSVSIPWRSAVIMEQCDSEIFFRPRRFLSRLISGVYVKDDRK